MHRTLVVIIILVFFTGCTSTASETSWQSKSTSSVAIDVEALLANLNSTNSTCDSNYSGCVPIASDVDCAGGSGNGPAYVSGPVQVIGYDKYGLDRDGDGYGCE